MKWPVFQRVQLRASYSYNVCLEKGSDDIISAVCVQRDRKIVYIVSQTADLNHFRGTHCISECVQLVCLEKPEILDNLLNLKFIKQVFKYSLNFK